MKAITTFTILLSMMIVSCSKSNPSGGTTGTFTNTITATVNGNPFVVSSVSAYNSVISGFTQFNINGSGVVGMGSISLAIFDYKNTTGSFTINTTTGTASATFFPSTGMFQQGISGTIIITGVDNTSMSNGAIITGNFNFNTGATNITLGNFSVFLSK